MYFYLVQLRCNYRKSLGLSPKTHGRIPWFAFFILILLHIAMGQTVTAQVQIEYQKAQRKLQHSNDTLNQEPFYYILQGDSLVREHIDLNEVVLLKKLSFKDMAERRKYLILRRRTLKVYPYAKLAAERLAIMDERLMLIKRKSKRKRYIRQVQKYIEGEFYETLRKFTRAEGRILVKLIHRQTGVSTFDLIREYRSGWRAFWYNQTAHWFDIELKSEYLPFEIKEDYYIEDILQRGFRDNLIERQKPHEPIDILELESFWAQKLDENFVKQPKR